jgi:hypothetical protein
MIRFFRALLTFASRTRWSTPPEWTEADSRSLATFLSSPSGAKLSAILHSEIAAANERAAMSGGATPNRTAFDCGWACGYRGLYAWFESLSAPAPQAEADPIEDPFGA